MDKQTYEQIDRIEDGISLILDGLKTQMNLETNDILLSFFEEEILDEKGRLKHLKQDEKVVEIFEEIRKEQEEAGNEEEEKEQYEHEPFNE